MKNRILQYGVVLAALSIATAANSAPAVSYSKDVRPILHDYCLNCHEKGGSGYDKSGLDMSSYQSLMRGTRFGAVIKPGDSFTSIFIQVIEGRVHAAIKMPYGMNGSLSKQNISLLKRWVEQGALNN